MVQKMNKSESVSGTLSYLDNASNRKTQQNINESVHNTQRRAPNVVPQKNSIAVKKIQVPRTKSISAAEPHLKQFAGMLSEELANVKKLKQEQLETIRQEELEKIQFAHAEKIRLEEERIRAEESEKILMEQARERIRAEESEKILMEQTRERIRLEVLAEFNQSQPQPQMQPAQPAQIDESYEEQNYLEETPPLEMHNSDDYVSHLDESLLAFSDNKNYIKEEAKFVTFEDLQKHYQDFIGKINTQLGSLGGGGEVNMRGLDDLDMSTVQNGDFISYDAATGKFIGGSITPAGVEGGVLEGGSF
tara:strand:- start:17 stop:931 length:915 start_codon:yes stop_codon:yes gene_type:complete